MESKNKKTIFISSLPKSVTEEDLLSIFENYGLCVSCNLNSEMCTAYVEFDNETSAYNSLSMDGVEMGTTKIEITIAYIEQEFSSPKQANITKQEQPEDYKPAQIFVGNIGTKVDETILKGGFEHLGTIIEAKVIRDADGKHKGYGFVTFSNESEAKNAIDRMNETFFHDEKIKCSWGKNKSNLAVVAGKSATKTLEEIFNETPKSYTNVFVTGDNVTKEMLEPHFEAFGKIKNIKAFPKNNQAFINYFSHESAGNAIHQMNGFVLNNNIELNCSWAIKTEKSMKKPILSQPPMRKMRPGNVISSGGGARKYLSNQVNQYNGRQAYDSYEEMGYGGGGLPQFQQPIFSDYNDQAYYGNPVAMPQMYQEEDNYNNVYSAYPPVRNPIGQPKPYSNVQQKPYANIQQKPYSNVQPKPYSQPKQPFMGGGSIGSGQPKQSFGGVQSKPFSVQPLMGIPAQPKPRLNRVAQPFKKPILGNPGKYIGKNK